MKKLLYCLLIVSPLTFAFGEKLFTFTPPSTYELTQFQIDNGLPATALPQSKIASYNIFCDGLLLINLLNEPLDTDRYRAPEGTFATGTHACHATTITTEGVEGGPSNIVNFTVEPGIPSAPTMFAIQ